MGCSKYSGCKCPFNDSKEINIALYKSKTHIGIALYALHEMHDAYELRKETVYQVREASETHMMYPFIDEALTCYWYMFLAAIDNAKNDLHIDKMKPKNKRNGQFPETIKLLKMDCNAGNLARVLLTDKLLWCIVTLRNKKMHGEFDFNLPTFFVRYQLMVNCYEEGGIPYDGSDMFFFMKMV